MVAVVGLVRLDAAPRDGQADPARILRPAEAAAHLGAGVIVFGEDALGGTDGWEAADGIGHLTARILAELAREADRRGLGGRHLLVGAAAWSVAGAPQRSTALLHQGKVGLTYAAGWPDPLTEGGQPIHRVAGELAARGDGWSGAVFNAHGARFGILLAGADVPPSWPDATSAPLDAVLVQAPGRALAQDAAGRRLSPEQPDHSGITLWHTTKRSEAKGT
jgi:hypothetical protein